MNKFQRIERVVRLKLPNVPGTFGKVADTVGLNEGNLGDIKLVKMGKKFITRDITVYSKSPGHFEVIKKELENLSGLKILKCFDETYRMHEGGLIEMKSKVNINNKEEFQKYYMPGIANIARTIDEDKTKVYEYTNVGKTLGIISNGATALDFNGLSEEATYSVLESRAAVINELTGISVLPIVLSTRNNVKIVETVRNIYKSFGMIIFEDLCSKDSFEIENKLSDLGMPVIDTNKTCNGIVTLAGLINIAKINNVDLSKTKVGFLGYGSKASGINMLLKAYGIKDRIGYDIMQEAKDVMEKENIRIAENINDLMNEADIVIGTSRKAGIIKFGMVKKDQILILLSKPEPEIEPEIAIKAGAKYATDGRIMSPILVIPGLVKGTLLSRASKVTLNMMIAAAEKLSVLAPEDKVLPDIFQTGIHDMIAEVVKQAAIEDGVAHLEELEMEEEVSEKAEDIFEKIRGLDLCPIV